MVGIGIRVFSNSRILYSIIEFNKNTGELTYITENAAATLFVPLSLSIPERFSYIRNTLLDILEQYQISVAAIKVSEFGGSLTANIVERYNLEGVIQELLASSSVDKYVASRMNTLSRLLGIKPNEFKQLTKEDGVFSLIPENVHWQKLNIEEKDCILACHASLEL